MSLLNISKYECSHCLRKYKLKRNYNQHIVSCELIHKIKNKTHDELQDSTETLPSQRDMFNLLKLLTIKCGVLEKEVEQLKKISYVRQKKQILEILNDRKPPNQTYTSWYINIVITEEDMKKAMEHDLTQGIIHVIKKKIEGSPSFPPVACFKEKPNNIYIYDILSVNEENLQKIGWKMASQEEIEKCVKHISHEILKVFVKWQQENLDFFMENEKNKDLEIEYMSRISGMKNPVEKRASELKKWLFSKTIDNK
jgi:hypothetical protein